MALRKGPYARRAPAVLRRSLNPVAERAPSFGTSWHVDRKEGLVGVVMTQRRPDVLEVSAVVRDFWTSAYQLIDD